MADTPRKTVAQLLRALPDPDPDAASRFLVIAGRWITAVSAASIALACSLVINSYVAFEQAPYACATRLLASDAMRGGIVSGMPFVVSGLLGLSASSRWIQAEKLRTIHVFVAGFSLIIVLAGALGATQTIWGLTRDRLDQTAHMIEKRCPASDRS